MFGTVASKSRFGSVYKGAGKFGSFARKNAVKGLNGFADVASVVGMVKPEVGVLGNISRRVANKLDASKFEKM
jgi:hypothetical protein